MLRTTGIQSYRIVSSTVYITPPWADFPWSISRHSLNSVDAKKRLTLEASSRQELSKDVSFVVGTRLVLSSNGAWTNASGGEGDIHRICRTWYRAIALFCQNIL